MNDPSFLPLPPNQAPKLSQAEWKAGTDVPPLTREQCEEAIAKVEKLR